MKRRRNHGESGVARYHSKCGEYIFRGSAEQIVAAAENEANQARINKDRVLEQELLPHAEHYKRVE